MLPQGSTRSRLSRTRKNPSQAHPGVHPLSSLTQRTQRFEPLPFPIGDPPYHYDVKAALPDIAKSTTKRLVFHTVGDTGGIKQGAPQAYVATAMKNDLDKLAGEDCPKFFYHLGDVVYFNGQPDQYYSQFYEPYDYYTAPIFAIPGNHDGDPIDDSQTSLDGWVAYFMTATPHVDPLSQDDPRVTLSEPNVYFTLVCPFATIVGMYTNVPEHGSVDSQQQQWLTNELATAPTDKALVVAMHHPIYSFDDHHSGSPLMADVLQHAINDSRRVPNLVLAGHVHNYQRIERSIGQKGPTPFIVAGNGGYYHLHSMQSGDGTADQETGAKLVKSDAHNHGYVTLTVDKEHVSGTYTAVDTHTGVPTPNSDTFAYPATAITLPANVTVSL